MKAIAACDRNFAIGNKGKLLCYIPGDLKFFKEKTLGTTVIMGRKTLESLPGGKPLPKRETVIISGTLEGGEGFTVAKSIEEAVSICDGKDAFVCGGETIYRQMLPFCDEVILTHIDEEFEADAFFPSLGDDFEKIWESSDQEENGYKYRWVHYRRKQGITG